MGHYLILLLNLQQSFNNFNAERTPKTTILVSLDFLNKFSNIDIDRGMFVVTCALDLLITINKLRKGNIKFMDFLKFCDKIDK